MIISVDYDELLRILMLVKLNDTISASSTGLRARAKNRQLAEEALAKMLGLNEQEAEIEFEKFYADQE